MEYKHQDIEKKWREFWESNKTFKAENDSSKPKYYVLDMFPYPSGAGLHVGHPLGYIASDIVARYKKLCGFNVLHPMGFDAFGLPAEQYAIQTGKHPAVTTEENINRYIDQLKTIGFAYDWDRMVTTSEPNYYKWTQWIFLQLYHHWYDAGEEKARHIDELVAIFEKQGNAGYDKEMLSGNVEAVQQTFTADEWKSYSAKTQSDILMCYRLAYQSFAYVNWCEELGTVLANDEVKDGVSERGGHPVERKQMRQWFLRITAYADRLHSDLDTLDWTDSMKEMQRNWIGKSEGALMKFKLENAEEYMEIFTTRPDTIFGVSFMVLAPESEWVQVLTTPEQKAEVDQYVKEASNRSERERMADVKRVTGAFTGSYVLHPFTGEKVPVWVSEYVLVGYGTGAVMAVPAHDGRDFRFAQHFNLPIPRVIAGPDGDESELTEDAYEAKDGKVINSDFITGMQVKDAIEAVKKKAEEMGIGQREVNYRLRDANYSRQRYWGEPFPIYYKGEEEIPTPVDFKDLPLELPEMEDFKPTGNPEGPLAKLTDWKVDGSQLETDTMPGFAGSSWYFLRYMDAENPEEFASKKALEYWQDVDFYIGGTEHAVGHLLYSRFWHKFLYDLGYVPTIEPFKKLVNQGMIQGRSNFVYRVKGENKFVSLNLKDKYETIPLHVDVNLVVNDELDIDKYKVFNEESIGADFELEDGKYICGWEVEKMSKSKYNVVNPDQICDDYGADTLRMYEMFLGPIEMSKPWNTNGIEGVSKFLKKLWRTCISQDDQLALTDEEPDKKELKTLHKTIQKIKEDIENLSLNTSISAFMICMNELSDLKCKKRAIYEPLLVILSPFAPHISEELWQRLGHSTSVAEAEFPEFNEDYLTEDSFSYPISFNGKHRFNVELPLGITKEEIEATVLKHEQSAKWLDGKDPKKVIVVPGKIVNVVV